MAEPEECQLSENVNRKTEVLLSSHDLEWASRLRGILKEEDVAGEIVKYHGDILKEVRDEKPLLLILTGSLHEKGVERILRELRNSTWSTAIIGLVEGKYPSKIQKLHDLGVDEYLEKPVDLAEFQLVSRRLLQRERLIRQTNILGRSEGIMEVLENVSQFAPYSSTVLIQGESGTGKELVAKAVHRLSPRKFQPFIALNCAALPESILESELFGHEKGAFTGASSLRKGRFEVADKGTLFLDEVGEMAASTQVKLLRVLEEHEFMRVGGTENITVDVRVITATNKNLHEEMELGNFRRDLYYRLKVLSINILPLRERREDIPLLVNTFISQFCEENGISFIGISDEAVNVLKNYDWPGNVRELRNLVESMLVSSPDSKIKPDDIPDYIYRKGEPGRLLPIPVMREGHPGAFETGAILSALVELRRDIRDLGREVMMAIQRGREKPAEYPLPPQEQDDWKLPDEVEGSSDTAGDGFRIEPGKTLSEIEKIVIEETLREVRGNRRQAAKMLGIGERTLYRKINLYGLR
jgi:DNA-binding NtrC family response regulator